MKSAARVVAPLFPMMVLMAGIAVRGSAQQATCPEASAAAAETGWGAYGSGDMVAAKASFEAALRLCANDQYARTGLAYVALRDGGDARAVELLEMVLQAQPDNVDALVGLGLAAWRQGDLEAVEARFRRVAALAPDHPTATEYLGRLEGSAERNSTGPADPADAAWIEGNTERALVLYSERLDENPTDGLALLRVGLIRAWSEQYAAALELLDGLVDREPMNVDARLARARVYAWTGNLPAAEVEVRRVLAVQPDHVEALAALAQFQSWAGQLDEALASYDAVLAIAPEHSAGRRQRAQMLARTEESEQSIAAYESLVSRDPSDVEARLGLATALAYAGDYAGAVTQYDQVLARAPSEMRASIGRARVLGWAGRLVDAERAAVGAVQTDPADGQARAMLGQIYRWQGRDADAKGALESAARLAPTDAEIRDQLRAVDLALAPTARPTFTAESDSDGNRMLTSALTATWNPVPRLRLVASGYHRRLELPLGVGALERTATGASVVGRYELGPGWRVSGGLGGSVTDGSADPSFASFEAGVRTPERFPVSAGLILSSVGLDATAALAERGVRATSMVLSARWLPAPAWRLDGTVGLGRYEGTEPNGRRSASLVATRQVGSQFSVGTSLRGFSFEKNLSDGYFDPDFYGVAELTGQWTRRVAAWALLVEVAPGVQQVRSDGDPTASFRTNGRVGYRIGAGREVSLSVGYSTAGLTQFATGESGYDYTAFILGFNWVF